MKGDSVFIATGVIVFGLLAVGLSPSSIVEGAQTGGAGIVLPRGVKRIALGQADRTKSATGGLHCTISQPLPEPLAFTTGVTEVTYIIEVDPETVPALQATIVGDFGWKEIRGLGCDRAAVCAGRLCQPQYGTTYSRADGAAIKSGTFVLEVQVGSDTLKIPFTVK